jgi:hypothetical protein
LDWGAPTVAGTWAAHPLEAGLGTASNNSHNVASSGQWLATASDGTNVGLGVGPAIGGSDQVLQRVDNASQYFNPATNPGGSHWNAVGATTDSYYNQYNVFDGHANSGPINTSPGGPSGGFSGNPNSTDQFYSGPYFWSHGTPNTTATTPATSANAVPWLGDHLVGFKVAQGQPMEMSFTNQGVDGVAFTVEGRSGTQGNQAGAVTNNWNQSGGGATGSGLFELLVQAYDNVNPLLGTLLFSYEIEVNGSYGSCAGLSSTTPVPCNDAPVIEILGTKGVFNIRSIVISTSTDAAGFYVDELHLDQNSLGGGPGNTPEPAEFFLIGGGLMLLGVGAKLRRARRA